MTFTDVIFTGTSMAFNAIVETPDTFFPVLTLNTGWRVFMATKASIATVIVANMTGYTTNIVIAIQYKILRVIKCRRQPFFLSVALRAITGNLLMQ
jgi:hypothetical protein